MERDLRAKNVDVGPLPIFCFSLTTETVRVRRSVFSRPSPLPPARSVRPASSLRSAAHDDPAPVARASSPLTVDTSQVEKATKASTSNADEC